MLAVASMLFVGCQQKPADQVQPAQQQSSKATITIEQPETSTSKATLEILPPATEEAVTGTTGDSVTVGEAGTASEAAANGRVPAPDVTLEPTPVTAVTMELP